MCNVLLPMFLFLIKSPCKMIRTYHTSASLLYRYHHAITHCSTSPARAAGLCARALQRESTKGRVSHDSDCSLHSVISATLIVDDTLVMRHVNVFASKLVSLAFPHYVMTRHHGLAL